MRLYTFKQQTGNQPVIEFDKRFSGADKMLSYVMKEYDATLYNAQTIDGKSVWAFENKGRRFFMTITQL